MGVGCRLRSQRRCGLAEPPPAVERRSRLATPLRGCACATRKAERLSVTLSPLLTCSPGLPVLLDCLME